MKGFTLIELLVVVLIIGILSSVALPKYQGAVTKVRTMRLLPLLRSISDAENIYFVANNEYTASLSALDIDMPAGAVIKSDSGIKYNDFQCYIRYTEETAFATYSAYCEDRRPNSPSLEKYFARSYYICWGANDKSIQICKNISGKTSPDSFTSGGGSGFIF